VGVRGEVGEGEVQGGQLGGVRFLEPVDRLQGVADPHPHLRLPPLHPHNLPRQRPPLPLLPLPATPLPAPQPLQLSTHNFQPTLQARQPGLQIAVARLEMVQFLGEREQGLVEGQVQGLEVGEFVTEGFELEEVVGCGRGELGLGLRYREL
jgi:hypothetical protein